MMTGFPKSPLTPLYERGELPPAPDIKPAHIKGYRDENFLFPPFVKGG